MMLPPHLVDYVAAHELAHLRELNHSPRFWISFRCFIRITGPRGAN